MPPRTWAGCLTWVDRARLRPLICPGDSWSASPEVDDAERSSRARDGSTGLLRRGVRRAAGETLATAARGGERLTNGRGGGGETIWRRMLAASLWRASPWDAIKVRQASKVRPQASRPQVVSDSSKGVKGVSY